MRIFVVFSLFLFVFACKNGSKSIQTPTTAATADVAEAAAEAATIQKEPAVGEGPYDATPIDLSAIKACSASRKAYMATNYWACFGAQHPTDDVYAAQVHGIKLQFSEDMKMKVFKGLKLMTEGTWAYDEEHMIVYVSSPNPYLNSSFKVQEKGFRQVWIGNTALNKSGVQIRWDNHHNLED